MQSDRLAGKIESFRLDSGLIAQSQETSDGWLRIYCRVARPDWDYHYFNSDGSQRVERIAPDTLFNKRDTDTLKMVPFGIGHPFSRSVNSFNVDTYLQGSTGHTIIREDTPDGEFLGIVATVFTEEAKQKVKAHPGMSPGYHVALDRTDEAETGINWQKKRSYNHMAGGVLPRGGDQVTARFQGMRVDAVDQDGKHCDIWVARTDERCYSAPLNTDLVLPILNRTDGIQGLAEKSIVHLDRYLSLQQDAGKQNSDGTPTGTSEDQKSGRIPEGFDTSTPSSQGKQAMTTTTFSLDSETFEGIPIRFADKVRALVTEHKETTSRVDSLTAEIGTLTAERDKLTGQVAKLQTNVDGLRSDLQTSLARADSLEEQAEDRNDSEEIIAIATDLSSTVDQMRTDGQLLVEAGRIARFNTDFAFICENMGQLQQEMIGFANPGVNIDGMDHKDIALVYETTMGMLRSDAKKAMSKANNLLASPDDYDDDDEDSDRGDARGLNGGAFTTLGKVGETSRLRGNQGGGSLKSLLSRYAKQQDDAFDDATKASSHMIAKPATAMLS